MYSEKNAFGYELPTGYHVIEALIPKKFHPQGFEPIGFVGHVSRIFMKPIVDNDVVVGFDISAYTETPSNPLDSLTCKYNTQ